jgi:DNA topoisomerase VI subunit A
VLQDWICKSAEDEQDKSVIVLCDIRVCVDVLAQHFGVVPTTLCHECS